MYGQFSWKRSKMMEDEFMQGCFRILTLSLALAVAAALSAPAARAQSTLDVAVNQTASTTCSSGEAVGLNGNLHFVYSFTTDPATGINTYQVAILSNLSGVGQATQTNYAGENASFGYSFPTTASPAQITLQLGSRLFSQGSAPNLMLNQTVNITVDTGGNISASVASSSTTCAGS
jgi:hypothetical protein